MPAIHLLIKPASGLCNLRCSYCFYHDITENRQQASYGFMSLETLESVIRKALDYADGQCTIAFQGGEPTLIGLDFYKALLNIVKEHNHKKLKVNYAIQTNGINLDNHWASFFAENKFMVGLSMDGQKDVNDSFRIDAAGKGTHSRIMKTKAMFDKHHVEYNILTVVNSLTARRVESVYRFYERNGLEYLQFIPCLDPINEEPGKRITSLTPELYENFLKTLFDLWYRDVKGGRFVFIRQFENYLGILLGLRPESCDMVGICSPQNVIEADGSVYPCDFYVLDEYRLGNLNTDSFSDINKKREEIGFIDSDFLPGCKKCKYFFLCRGGCKRHRVGEKNYFCRAFYNFFEYSLARMKELAADVQRR